VVALRRSSGAKLRIANVAGAKYPLVEFSADPAQDVDRAHHSWANYFLCGYKGVHDYLAARGGGGAPAGGAAGGLEVMVDGRVPTGSGLSSSSALVCASALAVMVSKGTRARRLRGRPRTWHVACLNCHPCCVLVRSPSTTHRTVPCRPLLPQGGRR
jgi:N-acetylgalactosamine kinase